jgi:hypothetical protein
MLIYTLYSLFTLVLLTCISTESAFGVDVVPNTSTIPQGIGPNPIAIGTDQGKWVTATEGGGRGSTLQGNRTVIGPWEAFTMNCLSPDCSTFQLQTINGHWVSAQGGGGSSVTGDVTQLTGSETFKLVKEGDKVALQTENGSYLTVTTLPSSTIEATAKTIGPSEQFIIQSNPTVTKTGAR